MVTFTEDAICFSEALDKVEKEEEISRGIELLPHISKAISSMPPKKQHHYKHMEKEFMRLCSQSSFRSKEAPFH